MLTDRAPSGLLSSTSHVPSSQSGKENTLRLRKFARGGGHKCIWISTFARAAFRRFLILPSLPVIILTVFAFPLAIDAVSQPETADSRLENFKRFVSNPPVIRNLVFIKKLAEFRLQAKETMLNGKATKLHPLVPPLVHARWQKEGFYYRVISGLGDLENTKILGAFSGHLADDYWDFPKTNIAFLWNRTEHDPGPSAVSESLVRKLEYVTEALNMGVWGAELGSLRWKGNHLSGEVNFERRMTVEGTIFAGKDGRAERLALISSAPGELHDFVFLYYYDPPLSVDYLPSSIKAFMIDKGAETFLHEIQIYRLETQDSPLSKDYFDYRAFLTASKINPALLRGVSLYQTNNLGKQAFLGDLTKSGTFPRLPKFRETFRKVFQFAFVIINAFAFILMVRMDKPQLERK